ncbi:MAG TPA: hypothetical protein VK915_11585 [Gaiellaceae bacterium]|nr:hypothetical protein [Gaiellaceae bacterium]
MRRTVLCLVVLVPVVAVGPALAAGPKAGEPIPLARTPGSELVEVKRGHGRAVITKKGSIVVVVRRGRIRVVDRPGGDRPTFRCNRPPVRVSSTTVQVRGKDIRCLVFGAGPWQVIAKGAGVNASGRVRGSLTLQATPGKRRGLYRVGQGNFKRWPLAATTYNVVR